MSISRSTFRFTGGLLISCVILFASGCPEADFVRKPDRKAPHPVNIVLREGFEAKLTRVFIDDIKIYQDWPVTDSKTGVANGIYYRVHSRKFSLRIEMPDIGVKQTLKVDISDGFSVGVSLKKGWIELHQQNVTEQD